MENKNNTTESKVYTVAEIQKMLHLSKSATYRFIENAPPFKVIRVGKAYRVPKKAFDEWFENCGLE